MNKEIVFSVVTIVYNGEKDIERTIQSVLNQTYPHVEYIVIDGASRDNTMEIVRKYQDKIQTIVSEPDNGIYNAMNKGLAKATGDFVIYCNSGDGFASTDVLERIANEMKRAEVLPDLAYGTYARVVNGVQGAPIGNRNPKKIWYGMVASHQSTFYGVEFLKSNNLRYD